MSASIPYPRKFCHLYLLILTSTNPPQLHIGIDLPPAHLMGRCQSSAHRGRLPTCAQGLLNDSPCHQPGREGFGAPWGAARTAHPQQPQDTEQLPRVIGSLQIEALWHWGRWLLPPLVIHQPPCPSHSSLFWRWLYHPCQMPLLKTNNPRFLHLSCERGWRKAPSSGAFGGASMPSPLSTSFLKGPASLGDALWGEKELDWSR